MINRGTRFALIILILLLFVFSIVLISDDYRYRYTSADDLMIYELLNTPDSRLIGRGQGIYNKNSPIPLLVGNGE